MLWALQHTRVHLSGKIYLLGQCVKPNPHKQCLLREYFHTYNLHYVIPLASLLMRCMYSTHDLQYRKGVASYVNIFTVLITYICVRASRGTVRNPGIVPVLYLLLCTYIYIVNVFGKVYTLRRLVPTKFIEVLLHLILAEYCMILHHISTLLVVMFALRVYA